MAYVTIDEVRAEGLTVGEADDPRLQTILIPAAQDLIERATRQWFEPRSMTLLLSGNNTSTLWLGVPIISLSELYLNGSLTALESAAYTVYNRAYPDDRRNPKIRLNPSQSIFRAGYVFGMRPIFLRGEQNQKLVGSFGFVDSGNVTPPLIKRAMIKIITRLSPLIDQSGTGSSGGGSGGVQSTYAGPIIEETVDRHKVRYANTSSSSGSSGATKSVQAGAFSALTGDAEVEQIMAMYRAPRIVSASTPVSEWRT